MSRLDQSNIHKNCIHYKEGFCTLNQISVDADGTACPRFTPKNVTRTATNEAPFSGSMQPPPEYTPQRGQSYSPAKRRNGLGTGGKRRTRLGRGRARKRVAAGS